MKKETEDFIRKRVRERDGDIEEVAIMIYEEIDRVVLAMNTHLALLRDLARKVG